MPRPIINKNRNNLGVGTLILVLMGVIWAHAFADDTKVKGVEIVPDTAVSVLNKAGALLTGDLTCSMTPGKNKYRDDYDVNPLGQKIPRSTLKKYDDGVR